VVGQEQVRHGLGPPEPLGFVHDARLELVADYFHKGSDVPASRRLTDPSKKDPAYPDPEHVALVGHHEVRARRGVWTDCGYGFCGLWVLGCGCWAVGAGLWVLGCGLAIAGVTRGLTGLMPQALAPEAAEHEKAI
jgi:hypothetical protein